MTHKQLLEDFLELEDKLNLFEWQINEIPIWEFIRVNVFTELRNNLIDNVKNIYSRKNKNSIKAILDFVTNILSLNPFSISKQKKYLFLNHPRRKLSGDKYVDIYVDPILPYLNDDYYVLEGFVNINLAHYKPVKTSNLYYLDYIQLTSRFVSNIPGSISKLDKDIIAGINKNIKLKWNIEIAHLEKEVIKTMKRINFVIPKIEKVLNKTNPEKIINVVSYSFMNQAFTFIAKRRNIPVYELQHGTVGKYHIAYNFKKASKLKLETGPDYFFAWGKSWTKAARLPIPKENIKIVGFPYFDSFRTGELCKRDLKQIVIISQYKEELALFANQLAEKLTEYKIIFKAHPSEYLIINNLYPYLKEKPNIRIIADDKIHLYNLFKQSNFVIGVNSTALIEALAFCPNIMILKLPGWEYFEDIEENKNIRFFSNIEEIMMMIRNNYSNEMNYGATEYFDVNSISKICHQIQNV